VTFFPQHRASRVDDKDWPKWLVCSVQNGPRAMKFHNGQMGAIEKHCASDGTV
jgi:hypothetical protein